MDGDSGTLRLCGQRSGLPPHWGIAAKVAIGAGGAVTDQKGALQTILEQPYGLGRILLGAVTFGLFGFALWCRMRALIDTEGKGTTAKGMHGSETPC